MRLDWHTQYLTSHGFAVAEIDYRGSTGYGRAFRNALRGQWGERDPLDCADAGEHLASSGRADPQRTAIWGASAGGYTALRALIRTRTFAAAVARSPVIDPQTWRNAAPKFQAHHADTLIGPWPEAAPTYQARSVLGNAEAINSPVLVLHGEQDPITPVTARFSATEATWSSSPPKATLCVPRRRSAKPWNSNSIFSSQPCEIATRTPRAKPPRRRSARRQVAPRLAYEFGKLSTSCAFLDLSLFAPRSVRPIARCISCLSDVDNLSQHSFASCKPWYCSFLERPSAIAAVIVLTSARDQSPCIIPSASTRITNEPFAKSIRTSLASNFSRRAIPAARPTRRSCRWILASL